MKYMASHWLHLVILLALTVVAASPALPMAATSSYSFNLGSAYGDSDEFTFRITQPGCILAQVKSWSRSGTRGTTASQLALILNGSDRTSYYARQDGNASSIVPLWTSYAVSSREVSRVRTWTISVNNFTRSGTANGILNLEYPSTLVPCEFEAMPSRTRGRIDLDWRYTGSYFSGSFLVERSTNGSTWSVVSTCKQSPTSSKTNFTCSDIGLTSGRTYYYRACAITSGLRCKTTDLTPATSAKAP
jgi:hypothetical protein